MESDRRLRVFISSPADVRPERVIAQRVVARLDHEFAAHFAVPTTCADARRVNSRRGVHWAGVAQSIVPLKDSPGI